jgi:hypothetical protein
VGITMANKNNILEHMIDLFSLKSITFQKTFGCSAKSVYNYRNMNNDDLPEVVWHKIFNFFSYFLAGKKIATWDELYQYIDNLDKNQIPVLKAKFESLAETRYIKEKYNFSFENSTPLGLRQYLEYMKKYDDMVENMEVKDYQSIVIKSKKVSDVYLQALEREINVVLDDDDYDFISYIKRYLQ